ncbi:MAG TPA: energy transducer TonB [Thermoanaerobaculia bacterium]|nr:energy transducer TonB [Thermoanaerobaculia bacterium]
MFEASLLATRPDAPPRRRAASFLAACTVNGGLLLTVVLFQSWDVSALPEPPERSALYQVIQVQLPEGGGSPRPRPTTPAPVPTTPPTTPVQPTVVEDLEDEPEAAETAPIDDLLPTDEAGTGNGPPGSVGEGSGDGPLPGDGAGGGGQEEAPAETIYEVGGEVTKPEKLHGPAPLYPEAARRARLQGTVIVEAVIDRTGRVTNVKVLKGMPGGLDRAAVAAVSDWRFRPATRKGEPVPVVFRLTVQFSLN